MGTVSFSLSLDDLPCSGRCCGCDHQGHVGCIPSDPPAGVREERERERVEAGMGKERSCRARRQGWGQLDSVQLS